LLSALFSNTIKTDDKLEIMKTEYGIPVTRKMEEEVNYMCNLGQGIYERGEASGEARGVKIGEARGVKIGENRGKIKVYAYEMNLSAEEIAVKLGMEKEDVAKIIDEGQLV
jgi:predicted transposase YdaD